jgi:hypothetical protein
MSIFSGLVHPYPIRLASHRVSFVANQRSARAEHRLAGQGAIEQLRATGPILVHDALTMM